MTDELLSQLTDPDPGQGQVTIDRERLTALHAALGIPAPVQDFELMLLHAAAAEGTVEPFELRVGSWQIDIEKRLFQSATATAILAAAIAADGSASVPVILLAVVLPFLLDVERIELRGSDRIVLARLRDIDLEGADAESAYRRLPDDLRDQLTLLEFADIWQRLTTTGQLDLSPSRSRTPPLKRETAAPPPAQDPPGEGTR